MCSFNGLVHGGIIATILDEAPAWAVFAHPGRFGVTREMTTRYLKPVRTNTEPLVEGRMSSHDVGNVVIHSSVFSADGTLLAEADSKWVLLTLARIASLSGVEEETLRKFLEDCGPSTPH